MSDITDPTEPEAFEDEIELVEVGIEAPEADAAEQHLEIFPHGDEPLAIDETTEADPADAADQHRVVDLDDEEYRG
ncbi:hypothetical protein [Wenjunlia tyrosinilytica]|jgi:hypothetical protein|uniref:Uncharacterized protein n=1 Tax=Wenjunlia tyrosinilytica TaxID=1544741 RepID=A0A917ZM62_9ACTN|nr:hypothetical protein [Wenjunlia tyrosinilytica]GGO85832.1 hypothetical protein GCM10012280_20530 [Wenjunlia tyrosinilytica]